MTINLFQVIKDIKLFNQNIVPEIYKKLDNNKIKIAELQKNKNYSFSEDNQKLIYKINKPKISISFDVTIQNDEVLINNLTQTPLEDNHKKLTLLIGNGLWRSITDKLDKTDSMSLTNIFKEYCKKHPNDSSTLKPIFENYSEEEFGKLDVLCDIYESNHEAYKKIFTHDIEKIVNERNLLIEHACTNLRDTGNKISNSDPYKKLLAQLNLFIENNNVDIATLNYDQLLYDLIIKHSYCDGFKKLDNSELNFDKKFYNWIRRKRHPYFHLHGSFLFLEKERKVVKIPRSELEKNNHPLIILTANNLKYQKIHRNDDENFILHVYNQLFVNSLCNNDILTIIGYGFMDEYMNNDIKYALARNKNLRVNLICRKPDVKEYIKKLSSSHLNIDFRIKIIELSQICEVTAEQLFGN